jgi:hypothetical protein
VPLDQASTTSRASSIKAASALRARATTLWCVRLIRLLAASLITDQPLTEKLIIT